MSSPITHIQEQVIVQSGSGTSVADIGKWAPGYTPVIVKALCVLVRVVPSCAGVVSLEKRVTLQSDSSRVVLLCVAIPNAAAAGKVYYAYMASGVKVSPGDELVAKVTDAMGTDAVVDVVVVVDPSFETPAANSDMVAA